MIVLDTHAWVWWLTDPDRLSDRASEAIDRTEGVGVSVISCWEVGTLARRGRLGFDRDLRRWVRQALARPGLVVMPVTPKIGLDAAALPEPFPGDPADRLIYATARDAGVQLLTRDRRLREFDPRGTHW